MSEKIAKSRAFMNKFLFLEFPCMMSEIALTHNVISAEEKVKRLISRIVLVI